MHDENLRSTIVEDFNYISERIVLTGVFKVIAIFVQFVIVVYFISILWLMIVQLTGDIYLSIYNEHVPDFMNN